MFILACEKEESLWNLMSEMSKNRDDAKKSKFQKIAWIICNGW